MRQIESDSHPVALIDDQLSKSSQAAVVAVEQAAAEGLERCRIDVRRVALGVDRNVELLAEGLELVGVPGRVTYKDGQRVTDEVDLNQTDLPDPVARALDHVQVHPRALYTRAGAEELLAITPYDVLCLDLGLPDGDGLDLIRALDSGWLLRPNRIIVLTARDSVWQRVSGLDAGADARAVRDCKNTHGPRSAVPRAASG